MNKRSTERAKTISVRSATPYSSIEQLESAHMQIEEQREHLSALRAALKEAEAKLETVRAEERACLAREIHDELGQSLTALKIETAWLDKRMPNSMLRKRTTAMCRSIDETIRFVRRIASGLRPSPLDHPHLAEAIARQLQEFEGRTGIQCRFNRPSRSIVLDQERSTALFRVVQEALTNVARHSNATRVSVDMHVARRQVELSITDNGRGISPVDTRRPASLGVLGMRERVSRLSGQFEIQPTFPRGTRVRVHLPVSAPQSDARSSSGG